MFRHVSPSFFFSEAILYDCICVALLVHQLARKINCGAGLIRICTKDKWLWCCYAFVPQSWVDTPDRPWKPCCCFGQYNPWGARAASQADLSRGPVCVNKALMIRRIVWTYRRWTEKTRSLRGYRRIVIQWSELMSAHPSIHPSIYRSPLYPDMPLHMLWSPGCFQ